MSRKMKDSGIEWIGEIPENWEVVRTKHTFKNYKNIVGEDAKNHDRLSLTLNGVIKRDKKDNHGLQPERFETYQIVYKNELIFKLIDLENVRTSRVGYSNYTGIVSPVYIRLINPDETKYGYYYFYNMWYQEIFNFLGLGVRSNLTANNLLNVPYLKIPVEEKEKIIEVLENKLKKIKNLMSKTEKSIEKLKEYKQSLITEAVTKGLDPNVEMKDSGIDWIGDIPKHWNIKKIKYTTSTIDTKKDFVKEDIYIGLENVLSYEGRINDYGKLVTDSKEKYFEKGNILYSKLRPYLAKAFIADITGGCSGEFIVFESFKGNKRYLLYWLISQLFTDFINATSYGAKMPRSSWDYIKETSIPRPPKHEENEIVSYLDDKSSQINKLIENKTKVIKELETYKKSLIYEYVTGKKEV